VIDTKHRVTYKVGMKIRIQNVRRLTWRILGLVWDGKGGRKIPTMRSYDQCGEMVGYRWMGGRSVDCIDGFETKFSLVKFNSKDLELTCHGQWNEDTTIVAQKG